MVSGPAPYQGTRDCLSRIAREEGVLQLFVGLRPACLKAAITNFLYFYLLRAVRPLLGHVPLLQGIGAGIGVQLAILPIDMVVTRLQSARGSLHRKNFMQVLRAVIRDNGFFGLWSGLGPGMCLTMNPGINQMVLTWLQRGHPSQSALRAFWSGALAKSIAGTATYPYMRAKVQLQVQGMLPGSASPQSTAGVLMCIVEESGLLALYDGLIPQLANAVIKEAILNMVRVKIAVLVARVFYVLLGAGKRGR